MKRLFLSAILGVAAVLMTAQELREEKNLELSSLTDSEFVGTAQTAMASPDYMVTAGDVYTLTYAVGSAPVSYTVAVDSTYRIKISNLAVLDATGKSYVTLKRQVEDIVSKNYPMSGAQFVLRSPSSFKVRITGEVNQTAEMDVWALTRVSSVVGGNMTGYGSVRKVTVTSASGKTRACDLFRAKRFGDMAQDPYLRPGDVVTVGRVERRVTIQGSVKRPGVYELLEGEQLRSLIDLYADGADYMADLSRIEVTRFTGASDVSGEKLYIGTSEYGNDYELKCYDIVRVSSYSNLKPVVFVEGALSVADGAELDVMNRFAVRFEHGTDYAYFVREHSDWFNATSDTEHAYIIRKGRTMPLALDRMLYDASYRSEIMLEPDDVLRIPFKQYFVSVAGAVNKPGRYPYITDRTYEYYVGLAGGFVSTQNVGNAVRIVDMDGNELGREDMITPECIITAKSNSFTYYFGIWAPVITTVLSAVSAAISIMAITR